MRHRIVVGLFALGLSGISGPVAAQSMNVPRIVETVLGDICLPFARSGDIERAVRNAEAAGYRIIEGESALLLDRTPPAGLVRLTRRHHGTVTLELSYGRGLCAVGIHEGGPANMAPAAEPFMRDLGLAPVVDIREERATTDIVVWKGGTTQLVIARSAHFSPGSELVLSFDLP